MRADAVTAEEIVDWRLHCLLEAGGDVDVAACTRIASRFEGAAAIDLHRAVKMIRQGCAPALVEEILG